MIFLFWTLYAQLSPPPDEQLSSHYKIQSKYWFSACAYFKFSPGRRDNVTKLNTCQSIILNVELQITKNILITKRNAKAGWKKNAYPFFDYHHHHPHRAKSNNNKLFLRMNNKVNCFPKLSNDEQIRVAAFMF